MQRAVINSACEDEPNEAAVLVLDEPSSNLDPRARREFGEILAGLSQTIVMVTHDLPYAHEICERAVIIDSGRIVADGPTDEILGDAELLAAHDLELPHGFVMNHHSQGGVARDEGG